MAQIFSKLNGIYSIAIFQLETNTLYIARDPFGVKPLYFMKERGSFYFGSELKMFFCAGFGHSLNINSIKDFLMQGYINNPETALNKIQQLEPGMVLEISHKLKTRKSKIQNNLFKKNNAKINSNTKDAFLYDSLTNAVKRQLVSDTEVGLLLSSGIDSMAILTILRELGELERIKTYTATFDEKGFSEHQVVTKLAKEWGFKNKLITITEDLIINNFENCIRCFDNLEMLPTCLNMYLMPQCIDDDVKVLLSGVGGDELFYGYPTHAASNFIIQNPKLSYLLSLVGKPFVILR